MIYKEIFSKKPNLKIMEFLFAMHFTVVNQVFSFNSITICNIKKNIIGLYLIIRFYY